MIGAFLGSATLGSALRKMFANLESALSRSSFSVRNGAAGCGLANADASSVAALIAASEEESAGILK